MKISILYVKLCYQTTSIVHDTLPWYKLSKPQWTFYWYPLRQLYILENVVQGELQFLSESVALGRREKKSWLKLKTSEMSRDLTLEFSNAPDFFPCVLLDHDKYICPKKVSNVCIISESPYKAFHYEWIWKQCRKHSVEL